MSEEKTENNQQTQQIKAWYQLVHNTIANEYEDYQLEGRILPHPTYGSIFVFRIRQEEKLYTCGFLLAELVHAFKNNSNTALWLSSFFYDMIQEGVNRPLPTPPQSQEETNRLLKEKVLPLVTRGLQEEFGLMKIHLNVAKREKLGSVLQMGFPHLEKGPNTCAIPLEYLLNLYLLNRDPSEHAVKALNKLLEQSQASKV